MAWEELGVALFAAEAEFAFQMKKKLVSRIDPYSKVNLLPEAIDDFKAHLPTLLGSILCISSCAALIVSSWSHTLIFSQHDAFSDCYFEVHADVSLHEGWRPRASQLYKFRDCLHMRPT